MDLDWRWALAVLLGAGVLAWLKFRTKAPPTPFEVWQAKGRSRR